MRIGNHKSLTEMARKSPHNEEFVEKLKTATSEIFDQTMDKLLINKSASSEEKLAVLEDLKDLRGAVLASVKMPEAARTANMKAALENVPTASEIAEALPTSEPGQNQGTTIERDIDRTYFYGPNNGRQVYSDGSISYRSDFVKDNFDTMSGPKNFLIGLNNVIGLASAVAALPPGPMAMSVGTMAKEEAHSQFNAQASGASASQGGSAVLLGLGGLSAHSSSSSHQSSANGSSTYNRESTDERLATAIQELDFHMEQAESRPANESVIQTKYKEAVYKDKEVSTYFGLGSKTVKEQVSSGRQHLTHHRSEFEPDRLWLPETGTSEFS